MGLSKIQSLGQNPYQKTINRIHSDKTYQMDRPQDAIFRLLRTRNEPGDRRRPRRRWWWWATTSTDRRRERPRGERHTGEPCRRWACRKAPSWSAWRPSSLSADSPCSGPSSSKPWGFSWWHRERASGWRRGGESEAAAAAAGRVSGKRDAASLTSFSAVRRGEKLKMEEDSDEFGEEILFGEGKF